MKRYAIREDQVAWRIVEGEAVLVHADTSAYYGLNRSATEIWVAIARGPSASPADIVEEVAARCGNAAPIGEELGPFLEALVAEGLLSEDPGEVTVSGAARSDAAADSEDTDGPFEYETPTIERFGQLETLILSGE